MHETLIIALASALAFAKDKNLEACADEIELAVDQIGLLLDAKKLKEFIETESIGWKHPTPVEVVLLRDLPQLSSDSSD